MCWGRLLSATVGAIGVAVAVAACTHDSPVSPSAVASSSGCAYIVSPTLAFPPAAGRDIQVSVMTEAGCQWTASTSEPWIRLVGTTSSRGAGGFVMSVAATGITGRRGTVTVSWPGGNRSIDVTQGCFVTQTVSLSPEKQDYLLSGTSECSFLTSPVSIDVPWLSYQNSAFDSLIRVSVEVNTGPERSGHVTTPFGQLTIVQRAGNCVTAIAPAGQTFDERGGAGTISVTAVPGCAWEAILHNAFGAVSTGNTGGVGSGLVTFAVAENKALHSFEPFFLVGGSLMFQITQRGCPLTVSPLSFHVPAAAADYFVSVTMAGPVNCTWTDSSNDNNIIFIGFTEVRNGPADVRLSVRQNQTGRVRTASANVADQTVVVTQDP